MPSVKGVQGNFFAITPFEINFKGVTRGDFGIHNDVNRANSPGSSGCIVFLFDLGWTRFQESMTTIRNSGVEQIPLIVEH